MSNKKIEGQISKLDAANSNLDLKIAVNKTRMRTLVGKLAGVERGDVVVSKGQRCRVVDILSETTPKRGNPVLRVLKIAKNGNLAKRPVEVRAWSVEGSTAPKREGVRASSKRTGGKILTKKPAKRGPGRPSKKSLEDFTILGTA